MIFFTYNFLNSLTNFKYFVTNMSRCFLLGKPFFIVENNYKLHSNYLYFPVA